MRIIFSSTLSAMLMSSAGVALAQQNSNMQSPDSTTLQHPTDPAFDTDRSLPDQTVPSTTVSTSATDDQTTSDKSTMDKAGEEITDSWITTKIKEQFMADNLVKGRDIHVTTKNHRVSLKGTVDSQEELDRAVSIAQGTKGVTKVNEHLKVVP